MIVAHKRAEVIPKTSLSSHLPIPPIPQYLPSSPSLHSSISPRIAQNRKNMESTFGQPGSLDQYSAEHSALLLGDHPYSPNHIQSGGLIKTSRSHLCFLSSPPQPIFSLVLNQAGLQEGTTYKYQPHDFMLPSLESLFLVHSFA